MNKKKMFEVLEMNDNDNNIILVHKKRITEYTNKYRDNEEQREKARECSRRWRENNPDRVIEYQKLWNERNSNK